MYVMYVYICMHILFYMHVCMCYPLYVCMLCMNLYMLISYEFCLCTIYLSIYLSMFVMYVYVSIIYALYVCVLYGRKFWNSSASWGGWLPFGLPFFSFPFLFFSFLCFYPWKSSMIGVGGRVSIRSNANKCLFKRWIARS